MIRVIIGISIFMAASASSATRQIERIYEKYVAGDLAGARQELERLPGTIARDGDQLFVMALLETDGGKARELMEAAIKTDLDQAYRREAEFRLILMAEARREDGVVRTKGSAFLEKWPGGEDRAAVMGRLASRISESAEGRARYQSRLLKEYPQSFYADFVRLAQAEAAFQAQRYKEATRLCREIADAERDRLTPTALVLLGQIALARNQSDNALLNYSIIHDQYRNAIGRETLETSLKTFSESEKPSAGGSGKGPAAVTYRVQIGVFSAKDNASRAKKRIEAYGLKAEIRQRTISGKSYYVVQAGEFASQKEARAAKEKLERSENELFKIVVDDEK